MSLHTWLHQSPCKPSSCATFMFNPHWAELPQTKINVLLLCTQGHCGRVQLFPLHCGLSGFSIGGVLQARILECIGQYWLSYPSGALLFPAALTANSSEYLVLPEPLQPKQLHHLHTWPSLGQTQVLQGSLRSKPQWTTHMQRWK